MCLLAAASRTNDVLIYQYSLENGELTLMSTLQAGEGIFCLYLDMQALNDHYRILVSSNESTVVDITLDSAFSTSFSPSHPRPKILQQARIRSLDMQAQSL
jgi:hypothetical protein